MIEIRQNILIFVCTLGVFLSLDAIWLYSLFGFYQGELGSILTSKPRIAPIVGFYCLYSFAVVYFAIVPSPTPRVAMLRGALLGLTAYGTYDLTNRATIQNFSLTLTCVDLCWGTLLTSTTAFIVAFGRTRAVLVKSSGSAVRSNAAREAEPSQKKSSALPTR